MFFLKISLEFRTLEFILSTVGANEICKKNSIKLNEQLTDTDLERGNDRSRRFGKIY